MTQLKTKLLDSVEINPSAAAIASVIWLHGLGADGYDFANIVNELKLTQALPIRFIFPHAPIRPVTLNGGYQMRAWYDIYGLSYEAREDAQGIEASEAAVQALIEREIDRGIAAAKIVLAGFSQGGAVALHSGIRYSQRLAGILALSTYLPLMRNFVVPAHSINQDIPIFMAHGIHDDIVPIKWGEVSRNFLQKLGYSVEWHTYPMAHSVCPQEISDITTWLSQVLLK